MKTSVAHATSTETKGSDNATYADETADRNETDGNGGRAVLTDGATRHLRRALLQERLALLVTRESLERDQRKQKRLLQKARLRLEASVQDIDYQPARNLERSRIAQLSQNEWVVRGRTC